jgi:hypothetical protein
MTFSVTFDIPAPIDVYDAMHAGVAQAAGTEIEGLLVHIGRPTETGFQILEVWESREHFERFNEEVLDPVVGQMFEGPLPDLPAPVEFELRGLIMPAADLQI